MVLFNISFTLFLREFIVRSILNLGSSEVKYLGRI